jgi:hypothetical protein
LSKGVAPHEQHGQLFAWAGGVDTSGGGAGGAGGVADVEVEGGEVVGHRANGGLDGRNPVVEVDTWRSDANRANECVSGDLGTLPVS